MLEIAAASQRLLFFWYQSGTVPWKVARSAREIAGNIEGTFLGQPFGPQKPAEATAPPKNAAGWWYSRHCRFVRGHCMPPVGDASRYALQLLKGAGGYSREKKERGYKILTNDATRDAWVTIPKIVEQIPWFMEKTCRESIRKILKLIHIDMEDFVDPNYKSKRYRFPSDIADMLIIFLKAYDEPWFQKQMKGEEATLEDNIAWIDRVLPEIEKLEEPLRSRVLGMPWLKKMLRSRELSEMTMGKALEMKELFNALPEDKRLEILEEIQPALDQFLSRLRSLAGVIK